MMERFEIQPVFSSTIPDVATFLLKWRIDQRPVDNYVYEDISSIERRLRWLLVENPAASEESRFGYCFRDGSGAIRGLNLAFPIAFLSGEERILGLCSGSFYIDPVARPMGFYLFRKYLGLSGYSFFFATTCNTESSEFWKNAGGRVVPNSDTEYFLPFRFDTMIPEFVATRTSNGAAQNISRMFGRIANPVTYFLTKSSGQLIVEHCNDWNKLSDLSRRHRSPHHITSDYSPEVLRWRYGPNSPLFPCGTYLFRDKQGNEGWFGLGNVIRGTHRQIRASVLLDMVWPREKMSAAGIFQEILHLASAGSDAIYFRPKPWLKYREYSRWIIRRTLKAPRAFVLVQKGVASFLDLNLLGCDESDELAWSFAWSDTGSRSDRPQASTAKANQTRERSEYLSS